MTKRLAAKTGIYQKDGQDKGEYVQLGVILSGNNGEYMLLDPAVNLAGVLTKQNILAHSTGGKARTSVMVSIFDDSNNQGQNNNQGNQQQNQGQQQNYQQQPQQNNQQQGNQNNQQQPEEFQDVPF